MSAATLLWAWLLGAALMILFGPPPRWLAAGFQVNGGRDLGPGPRWVLWGIMVVLWPAALVHFTRDALYRR